MSATQFASGTIGGPRGPSSTGKSAYQSWLDAGHTGTESAFVASLQGANGTMAPASNSQLAAGTDNSTSVTPAGLSYLGLTSSFVALSIALLSIANTATVAPAGTALTGSTFNATNSTVYYWPGTVQAYDQWIDTLPIALSVAGAVNIVVATVNGDGTLSLYSQQNYSAPIGNGGLTALGIYVPAGCVVGMQPISGSFYYTAGTGLPTEWQTTAVPSTGTAKTVATTINVHWGCTLIGEIIYKSRAAYGATSNILGSGNTQGVFPASAAGSLTASGGYTWYANTPFLQAGRLKASVNSPTAGPATLVIASLSGGVLTQQAALAVTLKVGQNDFSAWGPTVQKGWFLGIYGTSSIVTYNNGGAGAYRTAGLTPTSGSAATLVAGIALQVGMEIDTGLVSRVATLENSNPTALAGFGLLATADNTGVTDATSIFATARSQHATPNVPPGTFSVTSLPFSGEGFWGTGTVVVGGVTLSLPPKPEQGSRFLKLRAALVSQIYSGSALIINGDSISNGLAASSSKTTWVSLLTRFANMGIALDDAVLVDFDNSDASSVGGLSFHGVTMANPTTVTNGTAGPVSKSLMLQAGQSLSVTGAYERIDATYTGVSGGTLVFAYNGTTYKTVTCATTGSDVLASAGATGQTASGTYTITNTGSVAVEITSLMRFGVKVANSPPRLYVCRFAHGGYAFTNYGAAQIASMLRIATAIAGGTNHFLVPALGTNDEAGAALSYAALKTNVTTYLNNWVAAGVPIANMLPAMPWRWSSYASGGSFEQGNAAIRDAYRTAGIRRVIQTDGYDFIAQGFSSGDGHPNDAGMMAEFNAAVAGLSESAL